MMQHWMSWHEVLALAYAHEDRIIHKTKKVVKQASQKSSKFGKLGRLVSRKHVAVAVKVEDSQAPKEKDEYPTHLSIRHVFTDRSFVGLSLSAADRVLGTAAKKVVAAAPSDDEHVEKRKGLFKLFGKSSKSGRSGMSENTPSRSRSSTRDMVRSRATTISNTHEKNETDDGTEESVGADFSAKLYRSFKRQKEENRMKMEKHEDFSHLDTTDIHEKKRQQREQHMESVHDKELSHMRIEGYAELMAVKERFEVERRLVQRAELKRFLCEVFLDLELIVEEKKSDKGFFGFVGDMFYQSGHDLAAMAANEEKSHKHDHDKNNHKHDHDENSHKHDHHENGSAINSSSHDRNNINNCDSMSDLDDGDANDEQVSAGKGSVGTACHVIQKPPEDSQCAVS